MILKDDTVLLRDFKREDNAPTVPRQTHSKEEVNKVQAAKRPCQ